MSEPNHVWLKSVLTSLRRRYFKTELPDEDVVLVSNGMQIRVRNPRVSAIGRSIFNTGLWEPEVSEVVESIVTPGMTVIDVGADIGYYTLLLARLVGPSGKVLAFEPIPAAKANLDFNVELNHLDTVQTFPVALFDKSGESLLEDPLRVSRINLVKKTATGNDITVPLVVFDESRLAFGVERLDFVKIDVEGAELNVLKGMEHTLRMFHPLILIEIHSSPLGNFGFTPSDLMDFLGAHAYQITPVDAPELDFAKGNLTVICR